MTKTGDYVAMEELSKHLGKVMEIFLVKMCLKHVGSHELNAAVAASLMKCCTNNDLVNSV